MSHRVSSVKELCCFFMASSTLDDELLDAVKSSLTISHSIFPICVRGIICGVDDKCIGSEKSFMIMCMAFVHHPKGHGSTIGDLNPELASDCLLDDGALRIVFDRVFSPSSTTKHAHIGFAPPTLKPPFRAPSIPNGPKDGGTDTGRNKFIQMKQVVVYSPGYMGWWAGQFVSI